MVANCHCKDVFVWFVGFNYDCAIGLNFVIQLYELCKL